jgi:Protein of unknown function (DUF1524)
MPQAWREYWGADISGDEIAALHRDRAVHSLGNLTLVNDRLNPTLSNRPWTDAQTATYGLNGQGKRDYLLHHSELKLNAIIVAEHNDSGTEQDIRARGSALVDRIAKIWPRPQVAMPETPITAVEDTGEAWSADEIPEEQPEESAGDAQTGKYRLLSRWLQDQPKDEIRLSFAEVEQILSMPLPPSARARRAPWYGYEGTALGRSIRDVGWKAIQVSLDDETLTFIRQH